jgi:hypothetical protein
MHHHVIRTPERTVVKRVYSSGSPRLYELDSRNVSPMLSPPATYYTPPRGSPVVTRVTQSPLSSPHTVVKTTSWASPKQQVIQVVEHVIEGTEIAEQPAGTKKSIPPPRKTRSTIVELKKQPDLTPMGSGGNIHTHVVERTISGDSVMERSVTSDGGGSRIDRTVYH